MCVLKVCDVYIWTSQLKIVIPGIELDLIQTISESSMLCTTTSFVRLTLTRLALTSVLGLFGNSFCPHRCMNAQFGVRIPFQSQVQSPEGNPDSSTPIQSPFMFTQVTERPWEIETRDLTVFIL